MTLNQYIVAIPSYRRPETLRDRTLKVLQKYKIDPNKIYIFVSDSEQKKIYENTLPKGSYKQIVVGKPGIKNIRNFMPKYFKQGQYIFYIDDDIYRVSDTYSTNNTNNKDTFKLRELKSLKDLINQGFKLCEESKMTNWGVYPVENPYFCKRKTKNVSDYVSTKLCYIMGGFTGVINNHKAEIRTIDDKEDYERSIKYYLKDGGLLRFNNVCCYTKCYKEPGGMQVERTKKRIHDSAVYLTKVYPELCTLNTSKKSGFTEVRLRDRRKNHQDLILKNDGTVTNNDNNKKKNKKNRTKKTNQNKKKTNKSILNKLKNKLLY